MFEAVVSHEGSVCLIRLRGEFDLDGLAEATKLFEESFSNGNTAVNIDLRDLTFMDSTGLGALLNASNRAREHGTKLTIIPGPPQVQKLFAITGVLDRLSFAEQ